GAESACFHRRTHPAQQRALEEDPGRGIQLQPGRSRYPLRSVAAVHGRFGRAVAAQARLPDGLSMNTTNLNELHGLLAIIQSIDVGVVVLDRDYSVEVWNTFMENRSGLLPGQVRKRSFFELFPEVDEDWFRRKVESVTTLGTPSFTIWEQRPYLLRFKNYQPITGLEDFMYQNTTLLPLKGIDGRIDQVCLIIYDVTDVAINRRQLQAANAELQRLSSTDRLTGLYNRGHWEEMLRLDYARHRRYDSQAALVMFDIDHFKAINDNYGHQAGDAVIQQVAGLIRENLRDSDVAGR